MGLSVEVLNVFKERGVRIVYTSHDFTESVLGYSMLLPSGEICLNPCGKGAQSATSMLRRKNFSGLQIPLSVSFSEDESRHERKEEKAAVRHRVSVIWL